MGRIGVILERYGKGMGRLKSSFGLVAFWDSLRRLEPFWGVLGTSWSALEVSWVVFGAFLGRLLDILKLSWNVLKASRVV